MTEEEIRENAREFDIHYEYQRDWEGFPKVSRADVKLGFIAGAKSRDLEVEELKAQIEELLKSGIDKGFIKSWYKNNLYHWEFAE